MKLNASNNSVKSKKISKSENQKTSTKKFNQNSKNKNKSKNQNSKNNICFASTRNLLEEFNASLGVFMTEGQTLTDDERNELAYIIEYIEQNLKYIVSQLLWKM